MANFKKLQRIYLCITKAILDDSGGNKLRERLVYSYILGKPKWKTNTSTCNFNLANIFQLSPYTEAFSNGKQDLMATFPLQFLDKDIGL